MVLLRIFSFEACKFSLKGRKHYFGGCGDWYLFLLGWNLRLMPPLWDRSKSSLPLFINVEWMSWGMSPKTILSLWHKVLLVTERSVLVPHCRKSASKKPSAYNSSLHISRAVGRYCVFYLHRTYNYIRANAHVGK